MWLGLINLGSATVSPNSNNSNFFGFRRFHLVRLPRGSGDFKNRTIGLHWQMTSELDTLKIMTLTEPWSGLTSVDERERALLAPYAFFSHQSSGRKHPEALHTYRGPFQRDRDRILHSAAFRRLTRKMQVFTGDMGDYHRTRLTHTMEVASIARTIGRALGLNEDLIEALALLHDIGHPPFGHAGEDALNECLKECGGFSHNQFALTLVEELEHRYAEFPGLNLSREVLSGQTERIDKTRKGRTPILEAQVVDVADSATYNAHDVDDAIKLGLVKIEDLLEVPLIGRASKRLPDQQLSAEVRRAGVVHELIDLQVTSVLRHCGARLAASGWTHSDQPLEAGFVIEPEPEMAAEKSVLEEFLYRRVYRHEQLLQVRSVAQSQIRDMLEYFSSDPERLPPSFRDRTESVGPRRCAAEYLAGMTDRFCRETWATLFPSDRA